MRSLHDSVAWLAATPTPATPDDPTQIADLVITWSGVVIAAFSLLVAILTILFVAAGFVGIRELRSIRETGELAREELDRSSEMAREAVAEGQAAAQVAGDLAQQARVLIDREQEAARIAEQQVERVKQLNEKWEAILRDLDERMNTLVEVAYLFNQGEAAYRAGSYEKAVEYLSRAAELDQKNPRVRYRLGRSLTNLGKDDEAARQFQHALELGLPADAGERGLALLYRYSQPDLALSHAETAVSRDEQSPYNWNCLGLVRRDSGDFSGSKDAHVRAAQLDQEMVTTPFYLALLAARSQAFAHASDRSTEAMGRLAVEERRGRIKPLWAALVRWADDVLRGAYADADEYAVILQRSCTSQRRAREICDHMDFLLRSLGREEYHDRYVASIERAWLRNDA